MQVASQSADILEIQVQGSPWIIDSVNLGSLGGRFDMRGFHAGWHTLRFQRDSLNLPPGVAADRVTPETIRVQLVSPAQQLEYSVVFRPLAKLTTAAQTTKPVRSIVCLW